MEKASAGLTKYEKGAKEFARTAKTLGSEIERSPSEEVLDMLKAKRGTSETQH